MSKNYISGDRAKQVVQNIIDAPVSEEGEYALAVKDGAICKIEIEKPQFLETVIFGKSDNNDERAATRFYDTAVVILDDVDVEVRVQNNTQNGRYVIPYPFTENVVFKVGEVIPAYTPIIFYSTTVDTIDVYAVDSDLDPISSTCTYGTAEGCTTYAVGDEERSNNYLFYVMSRSAISGNVNWNWRNSDGTPYSASANRCWCYSKRFWIFNSDGELFNTVVANSANTLSIYGSAKEALVINTEKIATDDDLYSYIRIYRDGELYDIKGKWGLTGSDHIEIAIDEYYLSAGEYKIELDAELIQYNSVWNDVLEYTFTAEASVVTSRDINNVVCLSQAEYDAITPDSKTLYLIQAED